MKSIKIYALALGLLAVFAGCQNDVVKPLENDKEAPAPVRDVTYTKMSGSVLLTYTLPSDPDLLYVAAKLYEQGRKEIRIQGFLLHQYIACRGFWRYGHLFSWVYMPWIAVKIIRNR